jgi:hypothetical protein
MKRIISPILSGLILIFLSACDSGQPQAVATEDGTGEALNVCSLLTQQEVDSLFGGPTGPGGPSSPAPHIQGCVWPAEGVSKFILQVQAAPADLKQSIDMGDGYRLIDLPGLGSEAAAAIQLGKPEYNIQEGVAILAISDGNKMVTLSPVMLQIKEGSPQFELLQKIASSAVQRL